jgi:C-terminal processing protease CtpA/Prc
MEEGATLYGYHPAHGGGALDVDPLWPEEVPEVELELEGGSGSGPRRSFGLAVDLASRGGGVVLAALCPDGRAESAGLRSGDRVIAVDGEPVAGIGAAHRAIRGPRGTAVLLTVSRNDEEWSVLIERELVIR